MSIRTSIFIDLAGNMAARTQQLLGGLQRLGRDGSRSMNALHRSIQAAGQGLDRLGNRYTALLSGAAGLGATKQVGDLSMRLAYLGINAEVSREKIDSLYSKIMDAAQMKDIRVDPGEMLSGVEVIVQKLGDIDLAAANLRNIGLVMRATGAEGKEAGDMIANFKEKFNLETPEEMLQGLDMLVKQGHAGAFELKDLVTQGNRITAAYGAMGRTGMEAVREMGAVMQVFKKSTGNPEETATAFKNVFSDLMEPSKRKYLEGLGVRIWDPEKLKQGKKQIRSIVDIIGELLDKTHGDPEKLARIFGMQSLDGLKAFIAEYQKTGKNAARQFMDISGDGTQLMQDSATAAREFNAAMQNLYTSWMRFARNNLAGPVRQIADVLNSLDPKTVDLWLKAAGAIAAVTGGAILTRKGWQIYKWGKNLFRKNGGPGGTELPGGIPGAGNAVPVPVYVVNMPGSFGNNVPASDVPEGKSKPGSKPSKTGGWGERFGRYGSKLGRYGSRAGAVGAFILGTGSAIYAGYDALRGGSGKNWVSDWADQDYARDMQGRDALLAELARMRNKSHPSAVNKTEVGGKIKIEIARDGNVVIRDVKSSNPAVSLDVATGLMMRWQ